MSTATVVQVPGYPSTLVQARCRRCAWVGPRHDVRSVFAGVDAVAERRRALAEAEAAAHECDPAVLRVAAAIRARPGDPLIGGLEDVIRAVLAVQAADARDDARPVDRDGAALGFRRVAR